MAGGLVRQLQRNLQLRQPVQALPEAGIAGGGYVRQRQREAVVARERRRLASSKSGRPALEQRLLQHEQLRGI